ncbi:COG1361 family protein [Archaeoglobus profundus]|uniref:Uncharacterized protein n=1 Tax=Archaeoglobus profundus (strain DSM 5631 / JCM 9629 / NBRC 100127 / Av18) TaxID=572546 RepID=D2RHH1_ARCPA|nr:hypothetical protein [Archaeoglobus profundus]ADB57746.1 hypothetical protein Arcpr_0682 [Archaeoglobus profundus DSM 5631]
MKKILPILILLAIIQTASAQIVKIEITPQTLLPNDVADCKLTFTAQHDTYVSGITLISPTEVQVTPSSISGVGWISTGYTYEFPFTIKAKESGTYTLTAYVHTLNGTIKQSITIRVLDRMPEIVLDKTILTLNEVNTVHFTVISPLDIRNVVVQPLFKADPQIISVQSGKGSFKFEPTKPQSLKFKISFYNGKNYHEVVRTVNVSYMSSKGVVLNVTPKYHATTIGDVIPIDVEVANLRGDTIYSIEVTANFSKKQFQIPVLKSSEVARVKFDFYSETSGEKIIRVDVRYKDEFGNIHYEHKLLTIRVMNETALQFSGIEIERSLSGLTLTGEVCNVGKSEAYNIYVIANSNGVTKTYYIDSLEPSDFDTFEFTFKNHSRVIILELKWSNEVGEILETEEVVEIPMESFNVKTSSETDYVAIGVSVCVLVFVILLIVLAWRRK